MNRFCFRTLLAPFFFLLLMSWGTVQFVRADDVDFFAPDDDTPAPAAEASADKPADADSADTAKPAEESAKPDGTKPDAANAGSSEKRGGFLSSLFDRKDDNDDGSSDYRTPIETVLPRNVLMIANTVPVKVLNKNLSEQMENFGFGKLSPAEWIKLSPYGRAFKYVDQERRLGVCWFDVAGNSEPVPALFVPIRRFCPFAEALGADLAGAQTDDAIPAGSVFSLKKPNNWQVFQKNGYAVLYKNAPGADSIPDRTLKANPAGTLFRSLTGLKDADIRLIVTPYGTRRLTDLNYAADSAVMKLLPEVINKIRESNPDFDLAPANALPAIDSFAGWVNGNLSQMVAEIKFTPENVLLSLVFQPAPGSDLASQVQNRGGPNTPTLLDQPEFLKVLPMTFAPLVGQTDIFPELAEKLEPPFNRVRHVEYSFGVPQRDELLAESWAFFLEVDDSDAFVHELVVPKARMVGAHLGAEKVGEIAGQILGNLSLRRRMMGRRPLLYETPESAAAEGMALGERIGSRIGQQMGEEQALQQYDFEGYPLYVSDMEIYIQEMRKIQKEQAGEAVRKSPRELLTGEPTVRNLLAQALSGIETGSLDSMLRDQLVQQGADPDALPLPVRQSLILVLDRQHILIVPGNRQILSAAVAKWRDFVRRNGEGDGSETNPADWEKSRDALYQEIAGGESQILRSAVLFNLEAAQAEAGFVRQNYLPSLFEWFDKPVPQNLPEPLFVGTNAPGADLLYAVFPDEYLKFMIEVAKEKNKANR